jgi:mannose-6-phosphate isomerase-like protein (cupin superfamily)
VSSLAESGGVTHHASGVARPPGPLDTVGSRGDLAAAWGRRPLVDRGDTDQERFDHILTLERLDEFVAMSARTPTIRMVHEGEVVPPWRYCTPVRLGGVQVDDVVDSRLVASAVADGATLVAQSLHRLLPSVARFVGALQQEIGHPVQANAYLTPPTAAGLAAHADRHDVIALQLHGTKTWIVEGLGEVELRRGDSLYVPLGTRHRASTSATTSLHLTLGIIRVTPRQVLERLLRSSTSDLDQPLPLGYRMPERREDVATVLDGALDRALDALGGLDLDAVVDAEQRRRPDHPPVPGVIASVACVDTIDQDTVVRWVGPPPLVRPAPDDPDRRMSVRLTDRTLSVPPVAVPAISRLATASALRVGDLPGLDERSRLVLARRLVIEAACVVDRFGPDGHG